MLPVYVFLVNKTIYFNPLTATFIQKDSYEGNLYSPVTQNGYLYTGGNPVMYADPSGNEATLSEMATVIGIMGIVSSVVVVNYQHYIAPYLAMRAQMCRDNLVSTAGALRNAFEAAKQSLSDGWEILVVPERITNTIVDGIPVRVREVAIEIFPSIVQEEWKEVFPAHIEEDNRIILGPQVIDREVWDNILWSTGGTSSDYGNYQFKDGIDEDLRGKGTYQDALNKAFEKTGVPKENFYVTKWGKDKNGKSFPVEWKADGGAEVSIDLGHSIESGAPTVPHVGWQTGGKKTKGGRVRGHIFVDDVPYNR